MGLREWLKPSPGPRWLQYLLAGIGFAGGLFMLWGGTTLFEAMPEAEQRTAMPGMAVAWGLAFVWSSLRLLPNREAKADVPR